MADAWKCWVDLILENSANKAKTADNGGIYGLDGNPWSQSSNFNIPPNEVKDAVAVLDKNQGGNVMIGNIKYLVLRTDTDLLVAKALKKGITIGKAKTCVIIGQYEDHSTVQPGINCNQVCAVKDKLVDHGY